MTDSEPVCELDALIDCVLEDQNAYEGCGFFARKIEGQWCQLDDELGFCCGAEGSECCELHVLKLALIGGAVVLAIALCCVMCCCRKSICGGQKSSTAHVTNTTSDKAYGGKATGVPAARNQTLSRGKVAVDPVLAKEQYEIKEFSVDSESAA